MKDKQHILVTGGTGYIGSHICVALIEAGFMPVIIDNLSNSDESVVDAIQKISGIKPFFYCADIRDSETLSRVFQSHDISAVIHLAAKKSVEESQHNPLDYYACNLGGLLSLLSGMSTAGVKNLVYSSSATVYAPNGQGIYSETSSLGPINVYGSTKLMGERMISDLTEKGSLCAGILRYFNPVGAHKSGLIGESPKGVPNNLMPLVAQVVQGVRSHITVFGNDYDTPDGTAIRDFIHIMDVADAHISVLNHILHSRKNLILNIGTGKGHSVLDIIQTYQDINQVKINVQIGNRRNGDAAHICANVEKAKQELSWVAKYNLQDMCRDLHIWTTQKILN